MILTYPNYYDQTQIIGLSGIHEYYGVGIVTPYPLTIVISESNEYGITIEITLSTSHTLYPHVGLYPNDTLYPTEGIILSGDIVESTEYNITITQSGGS